MSDNEYVLQQKYPTITYDYREYNMAIAELNKIQSDKERAARAVDYMKSHDLSDDRYLFLFETARKISELIDVNKIETTPFFKGQDFVTSSFKTIYEHFNLVYENFNFSYYWDPFSSIFGSMAGEYRSHYPKDKTKSKIIINEPFFYTKHDMIWYSGIVLHEFWHHLQRRFPNEIGYYFSDETLKFDKYKLRGKNKRILYRYKPLEQEAWFIGYSLIYFLDKKTKFKYASKLIKKLANKSDKDVVEVLKNMGKEKS
jgi:hypothetical protein